MNDQPKAILLVEDNDDDIVIIQEAFAGMQRLSIIHASQSGEDALAYLRRQGAYHSVVRPHLVILDLNMPRQSGFEVLEAIKADTTLRHLPVIILSVSHREEDIANAYTKGAASYICKQVNFTQFKAIAKAFEGYWTEVSSLPPVRG